MNIYNMCIILYWRASTQLLPKHSNESQLDEACRPTAEIKFQKFAKNFKLNILKICSSFWLLAHRSHVLF